VPEIQAGLEFKINRSRLPSGTLILGTNNTFARVPLLATVSHRMRGRLG
jgi:hypothetical protein